MRAICMVLSVVCWIVAGPALADELMIQSFNNTGQVVFNAPTSGVYRVEWAPSPGGPWASFTAAAEELDNIAHISGGCVTCSIPMCYRVVATLQHAGTALMTGETLKMESDLESSSNPDHVAGSVLADERTIKCFENTGTVIFDAPTSAVYRLEWAPCAGEPWASFTTAAEELDNIAQIGGGSVTCSVPICYRVLVTIPTPGLVVVPGGTFMMGSDVGETSDPDHEVTLNSFYMDECETTYGLWYEVRTWAVDNGYSFANAGREGHDGVIGSVPSGSSNEPVTTVSWRDAVVWCNARSQKAGLAAAYTYSGNVISNSSSATSCDNAIFDMSAGGYRLPTEAEWEYAARYRDASTCIPGDYASGATNDYSDEAACQAVAWYSSNSGNNTHTSGQKKENQIGAHDMSGNVWEWCWDWYASYSGNAVTNPLGPPGPESSRVMRGGSKGNGSANLRCSGRNYSNPSLKYTSVGFRCARGL